MVSVRILAYTMGSTQDGLRWCRLSKRRQWWKVEDPPHCYSRAISENARRRVLLNRQSSSRDAPALASSAAADEHYHISLCHGPATILAAQVGKPDGSEYIYKGYKVAVFPDSLDTGANIDIGYIP